jgi:polar amino acid transport system substrate-binding protein
VLAAYARFSSVARSHSAFFACTLMTFAFSLLDRVAHSAQAMLARLAPPRLAQIAGLLAACCGGVLVAHAAPSTAPVRHALFVTDEWHDLTRKDGSGLYLDLIRTVFARQGVQVEYRFYPYARAVQRVKDHQADAWVASFMKEKSFPLYPHYHFDKNEQTILYLKAKQTGPVSTASLAHQRVAWLRDFGLNRFIQVPMRINELDTIGSAFQMLANDRIDYFVGAKSDIEDHVKNSRQSMANYGMAYALHLGLYLAFADTPKGEQLRKLWDTEMESFHKSEAFKAIYRQYGYPYPFP